MPSPFEKFKSFDQKYALSFFGFWLGLLFGGIGVYTAFFYEKKASLYFETQSNAPVYKINEKIPSLDIKFEGEEINSKKLSLSLLTIKIGNDGNAPISKNDYDADFPISLTVDANKIIRYDVLFVSNKYIGDALKIVQPLPSKLVINPLIIDEGQYFILKLLVINSEETLPQITAGGKIVGIDSIKVFDSAQQAQKESFWVATFKGGITTQATRLIGYFAGAVLIIIIFIGTIVSVSEFFTKKKRRRLIKRYTCELDGDTPAVFKAICEKYIERGEGFLVFSDLLLGDLDRFALVLSKPPHESTTRLISGDHDPIIVHGEIHNTSTLESTAHWLVENGIVEKTDTKVSIKDNDSRVLLSNFIVFLAAHIPKDIKQAKREWKAVTARSTVAR
jgi:hypothetical protein